MGPAAVQNNWCVTCECGITCSLHTRFSAEPIRSISCCACENFRLVSEFVTWHVRQARAVMFLYPAWFTPLASHPPTTAVSFCVALFPEYHCVIRSEITASGG